MTPILSWNCAFHSLGSTVTMANDSRTSAVSLSFRRYQRPAKAGERAAVLEAEGARLFLAIDDRPRPLSVLALHQSRGTGIVHHIGDGTVPYVLHRFVNRMERNEKPLSR